jgi:hypothetical protein
LLKAVLETAEERAEPVDICAGQGITSAHMPDHTLSVGGHPIRMSLDGWLVYPEDHMFVMRCTMDGQVEEYRVTSEADAAAMVESSPDALYFMLTRNAGIPFGLFSEKPDDTWGWFLGNPSSLEGGATGTAPAFGDIALDALRCRSIIAGVGRGSPEVFSIRKHMQHLQDDLQEARDRRTTAYARFCPARVDVFSSGSARVQSRIALDDLSLIATKGITLVAVDPLTNTIAHYRSYNVADTPRAAEALSSALRSLRRNAVVFVVTHGEFKMPASARKALEDLGARQAGEIDAGQPYILIAKAGDGVVAEKTDQPGTSTSIHLSAYEGDWNVSRIKKLWGNHTLVVQSASFEKGRSYVVLDGVEIAPIGRGMNVVVLDGATRAVKMKAPFDTYGDAEATKKLSVVLRQRKPGEIVIVLANDSATGGPAGYRLPEELESAFRNLGAECAGMVGYRNPYIFFTKVGSSFRIERCSQGEGIVRMELTPAEIDQLSSRDF